MKLFVLSTGDILHNGRHIDHLCLNRCDSRKEAWKQGARPGMRVVGFNGLDVTVDNLSALSMFIHPDIQNEKLTLELEVVYKPGKYRFYDCTREIRNNHKLRQLILC